MVNATAIKVAALRGKTVNDIAARIQFKVGVFGEAIIRGERNELVWKERGAGKLRKDTARTDCEEYSAGDLSVAIEREMEPESGTRLVNYYRCRKGYGAMEVGQAKWLKVVEQENAKLKRLAAEPDFGQTPNMRGSLQRILSIRRRSISQRDCNVPITNSSSPRRSGWSL